MNKASVCPDVAEFKRLATGQLSTPDKEALLDHLENCRACVQRLETLSEKDTLVDLIRQARTVDEASAGETVARLIEHLRELRPGAEAAGQAPAQIRLTCAGCGKSLKVKAGLAGKKVKCPGCQAVIPVPTAERPPASGVGEALTMAPADSASGASSPGTAFDTRAGQAQAATTDQHLCDFLAPAQSPDELGRLGPYRILKVLGAGGMGVVFKAEDPQLQRIVALKAMLPGLAASDSAKQRFFREARAAAALKHDHIVSIFQVGEDRGAPYLAMEFLEGESLDDRLKRQAKLPLATLLRIGREIAEGLAAAHERGFIHRDIKPANVWLEGKKARAKILDFGLARTTADEAQLTQSGAIVGTPAYMAPEQGKGTNVDHRCDLFSLGCVLYRMATGQAPFRGADMISTLMAVATENPPPPVSLNLELPTELSDLIMQLLAKKPEDRPESAQAAADTLRRLAREQQSAPALKEPEKAKTPAARSDRKVPRMAMAAALALIVLVPLGWWLSGIIVRVESEKGTLTIDSDDPTAVVTVTADGGAKLSLGKDQREIHLKPGKYGIELTEAKTGLKLSTSQFTIMSGGKETVKVLWEKKDAPARTSETAPKPVPADALRRADIPAAVLASIGGGDAKRAPAELVAVLGDGRFRITSDTRLPALSPDGAFLAVPSGGEVFLFDANSAQLLRRLRGRAGRVFCVAFSANGAMLAMGDEKIVSLWDPRSAVLLQEMAGHAPGVIRAVTFSGDSQTVLSCAQDKTVRVWDVATGRQAQVLSCKESLFSVAITPDKSLAVAGTFDGHVHGWSLDTGVEKFDFEVGKPGFTWSNVSTDGQWLASGTHDKLKVWKIADLTKKDPAPFFEKQTPAGWLQFEKDSNKLWTADIKTTDNRACCWDPASGKLVTSITLQRTGIEWMGYALTPNGRTLAVSADGEFVVQLYDTQTGKSRSPDPGHTRWVLALAFSPDGRWLASGGHDNTVRIWDLATGTQRHKLEGQTGHVWSLAFSPDAKLLASGSNNGTIALWDSATGTRIRTLNGFVTWTQVRFSPDGKFLAACTADGGVRMWSVRNGEEARMLRGLHQGIVRCLAFSADGQRLATGGQDGKVVITDLASGKVVQSLPKRNTMVLVVDFGADGETVAAGYSHPEPVVRVWNLKDKDFVSLQGHNSHVTNVSLRSDGRLAVSSCEYGSVRLWEIGGNLPRKMVLGQGSAGEYLWFAALSPDGRHVATGNSNGTIYLFRLPGPAEDVGEWLAARGTPSPGLSHAAWLQHVKGLTVGNKLDAVSDRLRELNPGVDRTGILPVIVDGVVTKLHFSAHMKDISPLRALPGLRTLECMDGPLTDLSPLKGMELTGLDLQRTRVSDLAPLKGMPLTSLTIWRTQVSDLTPLTGMALHHLNCAETQVPDLSPLKGMPLTTVSCDRTQVSDLSPLKDMKLTFLACNGTQVTDAGLEHLKKLTELEQLILGGNKLTGAGLVHLKGMTRLFNLQLLNTKVTDEGLVHLKGLLSLRELDLRATPVTDAGLEHLAGLKNLARLHLQGTAVTAKGVAKLKAALPKCNFHR